MKEIFMKEMLKKVFSTATVEKKVIIGNNIYMKISNEIILVAEFIPQKQCIERGGCDYLPYQSLGFKVINKITGSKIDENKLFLTGEDCGFELLEDCNGYVHWGVNSPCLFETPRPTEWVYEYIINHINEYIELFK